MAYAKNTYVSKEQTMGEINALISKHGGKIHAISDDSTQGCGVVTFLTPGLGVPVQYKISYTGAEANSKWRALLLTLKAKFVAIEEGFETAEEVFMSRILQSNGASSAVSFLPAILKNSNRDLVKVTQALSGAAPARKFAEL